MVKVEPVRPTSMRLDECPRQEGTAIGLRDGQSSKRRVGPSGTCCQVGLWGNRAWAA